MQTGESISTQKDRAKLRPDAPRKYTIFSLLYNVYWSSEKRRLLKGKLVEIFGHRQVLEKYWNASVNDDVFCADSKLEQIAEVFNAFTGKKMTVSDLYNFNTATLIRHKVNGKLVEKYLSKHPSFLKEKDKAKLHKYLEKNVRDFVPYF